MVQIKKTNLRVLALCLVLVLLPSLGTACGQALGERVPVSADALTDDYDATSVDAAPAATAAGEQSPVLPSIADVVATVRPSVVTIDTETTYRLFRRSYTQEGAGSGWIIDESGTIVTNNHVIAGAQSIVITLDDGRTFSVDPKTVAADPASDLAVLRIYAENLPAASIGDSSQLRVGDWLVAMGNPLGLGISAKEGIASRLDVSLALEGHTVDGLIETSAAINPGNSGGPLVNMRGEVIGITSAKISSVGVEGLGYAINIENLIASG